MQHGVWHASMHSEGQIALIQYCSVRSWKFAYVAPDLPSCTRNPGSARTWMEIYAASNYRIYGHCALLSNAALRNILFAKASLWPGSPDTPQLRSLGDTATHRPMPSKGLTQIGRIVNDWQPRAANPVPSSTLFSRRATDYSDCFHNRFDHPHAKGT